MPTIDSGSLRVHYLDRGSGAPVLVLHSAGLGAGQWRPLMGEMEDGFRLLAPNMRGYGRSTAWPPGIPADFEAELASIRTLMEAIGGPMHVVGHSVGARLALGVCRKMPHLVRRVVLIEPVALGVLRSEGEADALAEVGGMIDDFMGFYGAGDVNRAMERFTDYWYGAGAWRSFPAAQRLPIFARAEKMSADVRAVWRDRAPLAHYVAACPAALIVSAETTSFAARRMADLLHGALPRAARATVAGAGHLAPATHPQAVAAILRAYFDGPADERAGHVHGGVSGGGGLHA